MKLGSLFDGSGGFPLAGTLCGIEPIWAAEVEPYPIAVTRSRFPYMKHLGDISKINGAEIEPVDIITFGSPCQDLSVAGKRAGLKHEDNGDDETTRSGLFIEAVRIIKEMREKTNGEYPRFAVWENVPGAFSSNKGEDFRVVLEELIKVVEPSAVMPAVPQFGWAYADSYCGNGWSLAYRVLDAQYWGVPQRRRRIYLVADFGGECAREILFEREGLRGYFTQGGTPWKAITSHAKRSLGTDDREGEIPYTLKIRGGVSVDSYGKAAGKGALIQKNLSATLGVSQDQYLFQPVGADPYNGELTGDKSATLGVNCGMSTGRNGVVSLEPGIAAREGGHIYEDVSGTLRANAGDNRMAVAYGISSYESNSMKSSNPHSGIYEADTSRTLDLNGGNPACNQGGIAIVEGLDAYNQALTGDKAKTLNSAASDADHVPCVVVDSIGGQAERGWESEVAPTLKATHYKMPPCIVESAGFCPEQSAKTRGIGYEDETSPTLRAGVTPGCVYSVENHPADSRVNIDDSGKVQTLTSRMGTGGGNVPMVMETVTLEGNGQRPSHRGDGYAVTDKSYTLNSTEVHGVVYAVDQGGGKSQANVTEELSPTLTCTHGGEPAVAYGFDPGASRDVGVLFIEECGKTLTNGTCPGHHDGVVIATTESQPALTASKASFFMRSEEELASTLVATDYKDPQIVALEHRPAHTITPGSFTQIEEEKAPTLMARDFKDPTCVEAYDAATRKYIVRRLTPTECARLQGFADRWGDIDAKSDFTDEEYRFWHDVRNTHAAINGKQVKEYNKKQMLAWYNKLNTDSAEYKMWGNGIALPTALYAI